MSYAGVDYDDGWYRRQAEANLVEARQQNAELMREVIALRAEIHDRAQETADLRAQVADIGALRWMQRELMAILPFDDEDIEYSLVVAAADLRARAEAAEADRDKWRRLAGLLDREICAIDPPAQVGEESGGDAEPGGER